MKIRIRPSDSNFRLSIYLPLRLLKSRIAARAIAEAMNEDCTPEEVDAVRKTLIDSYQFIKQYVKTHGHFYLLDVTSHDGDRVYIRV